MIVAPVRLLIMPLPIVDKSVPDVAEEVEALEEVDELEFVEDVFDDELVVVVGVDVTLLVTLDTMFRTFA